VQGRRAFLAVATKCGCCALMVAIVFFMCFFVLEPAAIDLGFIGRRRKHGDWIAIGRRIEGKCRCDDRHQTCASR